jgi:diguanylate cyclase (GGDEF)-like protein
MEALKKGEIDCVFPANLSGYDGETMNIVMTPPMITTNVVAVVRSSDLELFSRKQHVVVAVNEGNPNYEAFLIDNFPEWRMVYFPDTKECIKAVRDGLADCVLISSYRYSNLARQCEKYRLRNFDTGVGIDYSFAVNSGDRELYSVLARVTGLVPESTINSVLSYYITEDAKATLKDFLSDNLDIFLIILILVFMIIMALMIKSRRAERKAKELISATETDSLTGLYSRNYFLEYANRMHHENPDKAMDAIVFNIEQFHSVNALNGRAFGDQVLCTLGKEIREIASENSGIAGRFEADRFDIFCRHISDYQAVYDRLQSVLDELAPNASIRLRMGVMQSHHDLDTVQMFDMARTACSMARGHYNKHLIIFDDEVRERETYEQRLLNDFRRAIDGYEFEVYYQPKYDIQSDEPKPVSAEALIRWHHPEFGMISPDDFIPLFERNGNISEVDKFVWNEAARQIVRWHNMYGVTIPVSVNLSRVDVFDPALEETLEGILSFNGLEHKDIKLEVTETTYTENSEQVIKVVENLRSKGFEVEMDDFGTGYSSLNMLSEMPVDVLKMDRNFIKNIEQNEKSVQLVALILNIAEKLHIPVVAEGVETESQLKLLQKLGCAVVQGYYFSRPLSAADFESNIIMKSIREDER